MKKLFAVIILFSHLAMSAPVEGLSENEFRTLATGLSHKVDLFRDVWKQNPDAEFFGGTSRDFTYWVLGQFKGSRSQLETQKIIQKLHELPQISIREFIGDESDIDIVTSQDMYLSAQKFGVKKIDFIPTARLNIDTTHGISEYNQGFLPVEKIRLGFNGPAQNSRFGDGFAEIYKGKLSAHWPVLSEFYKTEYAKKNLNNPILLVIRYLRVLSMDYFYRYGRGVPTVEPLNAAVPEDWAKAKELVQRAASDSQLRACFAQDLFVQWFSQSIKKAYRSYANPNVAEFLFKKSGLDNFLGTTARSFAGTYKNLLFASHHDFKLIDKNLVQYGSSREIFLDPAKVLTDGKLYHGTKTEAAFRSVIYQGIMPSADGSAGHGLYAVSAEDFLFASNWGGSPDRVVSFQVHTDAKIVDVASPGPGQDLYAKFMAAGDKTLDDFCKSFGVDIVIYPYQVKAFVIKNSMAIEPGNGHLRPVMKLSELAKDPSRSLSHSQMYKILLAGNYTTEEITFIGNALNTLNNQDLNAESEIKSLLTQENIKMDTESLIALKAFLIVAKYYQLNFDSVDPETLKLGNDFLGGSLLSTIQQIIPQNKSKDSYELSKEITGIIANGLWTMDSNRKKYFTSLSLRWSEIVEASRQRNNDLRAYNRLKQIFFGLMGLPMVSTMVISAIKDPNVIVGIGILAAISVVKFKPWVSVPEYLAARKKLKLATYLESDLQKIFHWESQTISKPLEPLQISRPQNVTLTCRQLFF